MAYDLARVQLEFREICRKAGAKSGRIIPIKLNGRLTRTLGRVTYQVGVNGGKDIPLLVEFSKQLIETATDKSIRDTICHEAAHLIALDRTGKSQEHNDYFKAICAEIGTTNDKPTTSVERLASAPKEQYKYTIFCDTCHKEVYHYSRMCNTIKYIDMCTCNLCKTANLRAIQNW